MFDWLKVLVYYVHAVSWYLLTYTVFHIYCIIYHCMLALVHWTGVWFFFTFFSILSSLVVCVPMCVIVASRTTAYTQQSWVISLSVHTIYRLVTQKLKGGEKPKLVWTFLRAGVTGVPVFSLKGQSSGGRLHNMSALGQHSFLVFLCDCRHHYNSNL